MNIVVGARYRHYKNGKEYRVIATAHHSETLEEMIVYEALYDSPEFGNHAVWTRPRWLFEERVEYQGVSVPRFERISDSP